MSSTRDSLPTTKEKVIGVAAATGWTCAIINARTFAFRGIIALLSLIGGWLIAAIFF